MIRHESACELSKQHECVMGEECSGGAGATREAKSTGMGRSRTHSWLSEMQLDSQALDLDIYFALSTRTLCL